MSRLKPNPNQTVESVHPRQPLLQLPADDFRAPKKAFYAPLERSRASVGRLCFPLTVLSIVLGIALSSTAWAQTEFEGNVSGEWTVEGSPYIQVGDAEVPEDTSLVIRPGVDVVLHRQQEFVINGRLTAIGTEQDTIRFHQPDSIVAGTLRIEADQDTSLFGFCRFDSLQFAIRAFGRGFEVTRSLFYDCAQITDAQCDWARFAENSIYGVRGLCNFGEGGQQYRGSYFIERNSFFSRFNQPPIGGAEFVQISGNRAIGVNVSFQVLDTREIVFTQNDSVWIVVSPLNLRSISARFENNNHAVMSVNELILERLTVTGNRGFPSALYLQNVTEAGVYDNRFDRVDIRNCQEVNFEHNLVGQVRVNQNGDVRLRYNTFVVSHHNADWNFVDIIGGVNDFTLTLTANIFSSYSPIALAITPEIRNIRGGYNCFWGPEQSYEGRDLLRGDVIIDPLLRGGIPYDYRLRADSPCIDAGDPNSPRDPDGTRADIGAFYFDQENGEPPALDRRWDYYIGWNETFRYAAKAVDEGEELDIRFEGLPEWLEIEEDQVRRDFVRDSVVVSGEVPEDQEDFVFRVIATDDADREDTLSVRVMVYPYRVLTGVVHGVLDVEQSPFIVADTAWIPAGDSLVLPPGTHLYFDNRNDSLAGRAKSMLMVMGAIKAVGEEGDSIYFAHLDTSQYTATFYYGANEQDFNLFRYCVFEKTQTYYSPIENSSTYTNSRLTGASPRVNGYIRPFEFSHNKGGMGSFTGSGMINNNNGGRATLYYADNVEVLNNNMNVISVSTGGARDIRVHHNIMTSFYLNWDTENFLIYYNQVIGGVNAMRFGSSINVHNNIISSPSQTGLYLYPNEYQKSIFNNVFINCPIGVFYYYGVELNERTIVQNNLFHSSDTLVQMRRGGMPSLNYNAIHDIDVLMSDSTNLGVLIKTNANGDSVDAHFNLYLDPRLANPDSLDFRLFADSPLINAGNPDSTFNDVDGTVNDIGLFGGPFGSEYEYLDPNEVLSFDKPPGEFQVGNAYPNPFNLNANISVEVPSHGIASFQLFDLQGRSIALHSVQLTAGTHRRSISEFLNLDTHRLQSGLYLLTVEFGSKRINRKLVLVK